MIGLFLLKHMTNRSDKEVVLELQGIGNGLKPFRTPKVCLSHVDGFTFLDEFSHENYSEARGEIVEEQIE